MNLQLKDFKRKETLNGILDYVIDINAYEDDRRKAFMDLTSSGCSLGVYDWTLKNTDNIEDKYADCRVLFKTYSLDNLDEALTDIIKVYEDVRRMNTPTPKEAVSEAITNAIKTFKEDVEWDANITLAQEEWDTLYSKCMKAWEDVSK